MSPTPATEALRHLEENTPDVLAWQQAHDREARAQLHAGPAFAHFEALLKPAFVEMVAFHAPRPVRGRWFHRHVPAGATLPVVSVSDAPEDTGRVLFDLASLNLPEALLQDMQPSPDGEQLLLIITPGDGSMRTLAFVLDAADGITGAAPREIPFLGPVSMPVWWPDGSGFLFAGLPIGDLGVDPASLPPAPGLRVFEQLLDEALTRRVLPLGHAHPIVFPHITADGLHAVICEDQTAVHPTHIRRLHAGEGWQPLLDASYGKVKGTLVGSEYIAVTNEGAPRGRLVAIPLASARDRASWREILPEGEAVLVSVTPVAGKLLVAETFEGNSRLRVVWLNGVVEHELPLPRAGAVGKFAFGFVAGLIDDLVWADGHEISFVHSSLTQPPQAYRYDVRAGRLQALGAARPALDGVTLRTHTAGELVYRVLRRDDLATPLPTIFTGYGGFNVHWLPCWNNLAAAWVRAGGAWVHVHQRGGGEFGEGFWRDGRMALKKHCFEDLFAAMDDAAAQGLCTPATTGLFGSSNGSLSVSAAFAFRPERFQAGVAQVPIVDILGCARDPGTLNIVRSEFGDPLSEADAAWIRAWSPFDQLQAGQRFPALLADAGANDATCPPWHARKLAAFVKDQGAEGSGPVLLRVREGVAHNVMPTAHAIERDAETLAFFAQQLGLAL